MKEKIKKKRKPSTFRHWFQAVFFALTNGYVQGFIGGKIYNGENKALCVPGLNCYSCPGAYFACPIGSLQAVLGSRNFKISCYVFGFMMVVGALLGRLVCGFLCPFGLVQDLLYKIPFVKKLKNLPGHKYLKYLRYVVLVVFVLLLTGLVVNEAGTGKPWFCEYICPSGTLFGGIPLVLANESLQPSIGWRFWMKVALLVAVLLLSVLSYRPFCKYVCPLGALYGVCNPIALYRYRVNKDKCVGCGACQKACGMDIKVWEKPNSSECIRCGECKAACPTHAITSTWDELKARLIKDLPEEAASVEASTEKRTGDAPELPEQETEVTDKATKTPKEKGSALRVALGLLVAIVGLVVFVAMGFFLLSWLIRTLLGQGIDSRDIFNITCMFGTMFFCFLAGVIMFRFGMMIGKNGGRYTASTRALRILVPAVFLLVVSRILNLFVQNTFTILISAALWWSVPLIGIFIGLSCMAEKRRVRKAREEGKEKKETEGGVA